MVVVVVVIVVVVVVVVVVVPASENMHGCFSYVKPLILFLY